MEDNNSCIEDVSTFFLWPIKAYKGFTLSSNWKDIDNVSPDHEITKSAPEITEYFDSQVLESVTGNYSIPDITITYESTAEYPEFHKKWKLIPRLFRMESDIWILRIEAKPTLNDNENITIAQVLDFNETFRYCDIKSYQKKPDDAARFRFKACTGDQIIRFGDDDIFIATGQFLLRILVPEQTPTNGNGFIDMLDVSGISQCLDKFDKMIVFSSVVSPDITPVDLFRLTTVDMHDSHLPTDDYISMSKGASLYSRWTDESLGFTGYSMSWVIRDMWRDDMLAKDARMLYGGFLAISLVYQLSFLADYSRQLSKLDADGNQQEIRDLRKQILEFTNKSWFSRITYEVQGHEIYTLWRKEMDLDTLYKELHSELAETDEYIRMKNEELSKKKTEEISERINKIQIWGFWIALVSIIYTLANEVIQYMNK